MPYDLSDEFRWEVLIGMWEDEGFAESAFLRPDGGVDIDMRDFLLRIRPPS